MGYLTFEYSPNADGFLTSLYKKGYYKKRFIATASSIYYFSTLEYAFDGTDNIFHTNSEENAYIAFFLIGGSIKVTDFITMQRKSLDKMKSFVFQGSTNGINWTNLVTQDDTKLCTSNELIHETVNSDQMFTQLRLVQTDNRCTSGKYLNFISVDFFGFYEFSSLTKECLSLQLSSLVIVNFFFMLY